MGLDNKKTIHAESEAETMPALHPIDVENYDASPNIILISSDDENDDEDEAEKDVAASYRIEWLDGVVVVNPPDTSASHQLSLSKQNSPYNSPFNQEPIEILEHEIKKLKRSRIPIVKVRRNSKRGPEYT
ncbi:hypothetical protein Tco_0854237 [Tanacetum coccineum]